MDETLQQASLSIRGEPGKLGFNFAGACCCHTVIVPFLFAKSTAQAPPFFGSSQIFQNAKPIWRRIYREPRTSSTDASNLHAFLKISQGKWIRLYPLAVKDIYYCLLLNPLGRQMPLPGLPQK